MKKLVHIMSANYFIGTSMAWKETAESSSNPEQSLSNMMVR